jgi:hypothetical protein
MKRKGHHLLVCKLSLQMVGPWAMFKVQTLEARYVSSSPNALVQGRCNQIH